jgi:hypothetical protein
MENVICENCGSDNTTKSKYCKECGHELPKVDIVTLENPVEEKKVVRGDNKKKILSSVVGVIAFFITYYAVQHFFFNSSIDKDMMGVASELNKSCPVMIDSETRLDNTIALPDKVFQYNYTLVNVEKNQVDTISIKNYLEPNIVNQVKTNPQMQYQREHKWTLNYLYKDKKGLYILMVKVTPDKYAE